MSTLAVTYTWDTAGLYNAWTHTPGTSVTLTNAAGGDGGTTCLGNDRAVKGNSGANSTHTLTTTWAALGVPTGNTVTGVTGASMKSKCITFTSAGSGNTSGAATLVDGATTITLSSQRSITATDANFVTTNGVDSTGLALAAANSITFTINVHNQNTNTSGSDVNILQDTLTFTITYEDRASLSATLGATTLSATAEPVVGGSASITLDADTLSATAGPIVGGVATFNLGADTLSAAGGPIVDGSASITEDATTLVAAGVVGTLSSSNPASALFIGA